MGVLNLCFVLLLPLSVCSDSEETLVKTVGKKPDITPICTNETGSVITLLVCKIRTERSRGEECRLVYQYPLGFEHGCDSRFTLLMKNQTVFLHLTDLTAEDSGNYTCECSHLDGTYIIHLNITVEDTEEDGSSSTGLIIPCALTAPTVLIIVTLVILRCIHRKLRHGKQPESLSSHPNTGSEDIEPYSTFMQTESGLYSTVKLHSSTMNTNNSNMATGEDAHLMKPM